MGKLSEGRAIVVDIGKTLAKVSLWSRQGLCLEKRARAHVVPCPAPYVPLDCAATADWLIGALADFAGHPVEAIIPVTHGAALAGVKDGVLAFASPDYEWEIPAEQLAAYRTQRDAFAVTGSPELPAGLNMGAQIHYLESLGLLDGVTLMPYAQYWAWLLSGVAVSEVTSLGCHSDLWAPAAGDFSPLAKRRGWAGKFAPLAKAGDVIGTLTPELAVLTGLSPQVRIHAGLHDSNAALIAARGFPEIADNEATVLSTGTWFIAMRSLGCSPNASVVAEARDCLINIDAFGQAVPTARFMGGRELELLGARIDRAGLDGLADVLHTGAMALPSQMRGCGPFPDCLARLIEWPEDEAERTAAAALYAALMTDAALDLIGASGRLLIEGRFARSELFTRALASLRPDTRVYTASAEVDVSFGALRMIWPDVAAPATISPVQPLDRDLNTYRDVWYDSIAAFA